MTTSRTSSRRCAHSPSTSSWCPTPSSPSRAGAPSTTLPTRSGPARTSASTSGPTRRRWRAFGMDRLAEYDELILMNYTFFAPIFPFAETFDAMDARDDLDFWGITAHKAIDPNPWPDTRRHSAAAHPVPLDRRAARRCSPRSSGPGTGRRCRPITSYTGSIMQHESTVHPALLRPRLPVHGGVRPGPLPAPTTRSSTDAVLMLEDRCPILKRRIFFHEPTYLERNAILGKRVMDLVAESRLPDRPDLAQRRPLGRAADAVHQHVDALDVIPDIDLGYRPDPPPRICVLAHIYYEDMTDEMMGWIEQHPGALRPRRRPRPARRRSASSRRPLDKYGAASVRGPGRRIQPRPGRERLHHRPAVTC